MREAKRHPRASARERQPGITRLLDRIEARGLVTRQRSREDRRQVLCRITPAGLALLKLTDAPLDRIEGERLGRLGKAELRRLVAALDRLREERG